MTDLSKRHPGTTGLLEFFSRLPTDSYSKGLMDAIRDDCGGLAHAMVSVLPDGPELTTGLRKLLEAKDCFVRAALAAKPGS